MRYLFFTNTPAHVHLYRNAVERLRAAGHEVLVLGRRYGCTEALLEYHDLPYQIYGEYDAASDSLYAVLPQHYAGAIRRTLRFDPDCVFGYGAYAAHAGAVARTPTILVLDSEPTPIDHAVSRPFARAILTPHVFGKDLGARHYRFRGFKECAYLHPEVYEPDPGVRDALGLAPGEPYALCRFNALDSLHDIGEHGFSPGQRRELVDRLADHVTVLVSDEGGEMALEDTAARPFDLHPARFHDALAAADLLVADTQTVATEAALLGTPVVRSNSFVGESDMGNFRELERHGLVRNVPSFDEVLETVLDLVTDDEAGAMWRRRRDAFMADKVNLTDLIVETARNVEAIERVPALSRDRPPATP
jgi:predicted glycosyltransferase